MTALLPVAQAGSGFYPHRVLYYALAVLVALVVHEYAHAFVASRLGDVSPRAMGRLTLDPRPHADVFGSYVLPGLLLLWVLFQGNWVVFAYAKPMPLNPWNVRRQSRDVILIHAAGPAANLALALVFGLLRLVTCGSPIVPDVLDVMLRLNVLFAAIHLIPIPPLDASRAIAPALPPRAREILTNTLEPLAPLFMLLVFFILGAFFLGIVGVLAGGLGALIPGSTCPVV